MPLNDAAFEIFFRKYFGLLCSYCQIKFGFDADLSKEVVHSGFIRLWENRQNLAADLPVKVYLYKIISNIAVDMVRHQKVKLKHEKYVLQNSSDAYSRKDFDDPEIKHLAAAIDKAVSELPEQTRRVFELSRYHGYRYADISTQLNISIKTVETHMSRALSKLRLKLSEYLPIFIVLFYYIN